MVHSNDISNIARFWRFPEFRDHRRNVEKYQRYASHQDFLIDCSKNKLIPKGFRLKWNLNMNSIEFQDKKVEETLLETSSKLIKVAIETSKHQVETIRGRLQETDLKLKAILSTEDYAIFSDYMIKHTMKIRKSLEKTKKKKIAWCKRKVKHNPQARTLLINKNNFEKSDISTDIESDISQKIKTIRREVETETHLINRNEGSQKTMKIIQMKADGHCYFRAISQALYGHQEEHPSIRKKVVTELMNNKTSYAKYVSGDYNEHLKNMSEGDKGRNSWATEAEIFATTRCYNTDIFITSNINDKWIWQRFAKFDICERNKSYITLMYNDHHFNFVEVDQKPCWCNTCINPETSHNYNLRSQSKRENLNSTENDNHNSLTSSPDKENNYNLRSRSKKKKPF